MDRSATAHNLMGVPEGRTDFLLFSERYRDRSLPSCYAKCCWVEDTVNLQMRGHGRRDSFVWVRRTEVTFFSAYLTTNESVVAFLDRFAALKDEIRNADGGVLVGGDFNTRALELDMPHPDS